MWFFGRKKLSPPPGGATSAPLAAVQTIPHEFYAGANPAVTFKTVSKEIILSSGNVGKKSISPATGLSRPTVSPAARLVHSWLLSRRLLLLGGAGLFVIAVAVASGYYWRVANRSAAPSAPPPEVATEDAAPATVPEPPPSEAPTSTIEETTPDSAPTTTVSEGALVFPSLLLGDSADADNDALTDAEEELFKTDPMLADTDLDRYPDGHEIYNLYNPAGKEPEKIIESGLVVDYQNPVFGYRLYYPVNWAVGAVDVNYRDVLFSTITGEYVEVRVFDKESGEDFTSWLTRVAEEERITDLVDFESIFKVPSKRRRDYLVYYFEDDKRFYAMLYHTTGSVITNYRLVIKMMARSFRLPASISDIPVRSEVDEAPDDSAVVSTTPVTATSSAGL